MQRKIGGNRRPGFSSPAPLLLSSFILAPLYSALAHSPAEHCATINQLRLTGVSTIDAQLVEAGNFKFSDGSTAPVSNAFCRVRATAMPSKDSDIKFEVWLPAADWNGRLLGVGNGWFAGSISDKGLAKRVAAGYAVVATDTGHHTPQIDTSWALGHPEKVIDFGHRAIHLVSVHAKHMIAAYYGRGPDHSYFTSCSNGGRQALMEAQRYPEDYDGIMAGAPAADWTHIYVGAAMVNIQWLAAGLGFLPAKKLPAIHAAVLAACDSLDGVKDGVIDDPRRCHFQPSVLTCQGPEADSCLTTEQVSTLDKLYQGPALSSGKQLLPGYSPGTELGWSDALLGDGPGTTETYQAVVDFFRNMVFENAQWDARSFDAERAGKLADRKWASTLNATNPDLSQFIARGGKLILYHGWSDPLVPAMGTIDYYQRVVNTVGKTKAGSSVRLFMAPGMDHCGGGPGPNDFGQFDAGNGDPESNLAAALQRWVEDAVAPEQVIATKRKDGDDPPGTVVQRTRPLCAYPLTARYRGAGDTDRAASFTCAMATMTTR